jgi:CDP-diacylglycerol---serine O-phosphatidyltransferase
VTLANIAFGVLSVISAAEGSFGRASAFIFVAGLCDMVDGKLARVLNATSKFGQELDSLSDATSFGFAPAVLIYLAALKEAGWVGVAVSVLYALCAVVRLARFNIDTREICKVSFLGCPVPCAGGYIVSLVLVRQSLPLWLIAVGTVIVALGMVSTLKVPKFRKNGAPAFMLYVGILLFLGFLVWPTALAWHVWNGWNMVALATNYVVLYRGGYLRKTEAGALASGPAQ